MGPCLRLKWTVQGATVLTKQKTLLKSDAGMESNSVRETRRTALPCGLQSQVLQWVGLGELGLPLAGHLAHVLIQSDGMCIAQSKWFPAWESLGGWQEILWTGLFSPSLEVEMANHSSILTWRIHGQRSLAGYTVHGVARVRHNWVT